jgi:hypothetical protein
VLDVTIIEAGAGGIATASILNGIQVGINSLTLRDGYDVQVQCGSRIGPNRS